MDHQAISKLSENAKARIFRFLCKLASTDGVVHSEELKILDKFRLTFGFDGETTLRLALESQSKSVAIGKSEHERDLLINAVIEIVAADGKFDEQEQHRVLGFARSSGLSSTRLKARITKAIDRNQKTRILKRDRLSMPIKMTSADFDDIDESDETQKS